MKILSKWGLAVGVVLFALEGCATFRSNPIDAPTEWPATKSDKPSIAVSVRSEIFDNGKIMAQTGDPGVDLWARRVIRAYELSGLFSSVTRGRGDADLYAEVRTVQDMEASIGMAVLSGLTLTLIPSITRADFQVTTTFKDEDGNELGTIEKSEQVSTVIQMFMVFAMPTNFPTGVISRTFTELNWATLEEARRQGWTSK